MNETNKVTQEISDYPQSEIKEITIMKYLDFMSKEIGADLSAAEDAGYLCKGYLTEKGYALFDIASKKVYPVVAKEFSSKETSELDKLFKV